jgi:hypothetical protein
MERGRCELPCTVFLHLDAVDCLMRHQGMAAAMIAVPLEVRE